MSEGRRTLEELLAEARAKIDRLSPAEAVAAVDGGGLIVDIRSTGARERDGIVPGSVHIPRTVLEWRLEPGGVWRNPHVDRLDRQPGLPVAMPSREAGELPGMGGPD